MIALLALAASYGFQGVELGMTEAQVRSLVPTLKCTGEVPFLEVTPEQAAAGTKECVPTQVIGSDPVAAQASVGDYQGGIYYDLTNGVVARIEFWPDYPVAEAVLAGLSEKFGPPKELKRGVWEAVSGQKVLSIDATWTKGDQTIELHAPSVKIDKMTVIYHNRIETERVVPASM